jgi:hypothetical protein
MFAKVDQILDFLSSTPLSALHQISDGTNKDLLETYDSFLTSLKFLRKNYKLSDPDWWPFICATDRPNYPSHHVFMRRHNLALSMLMLLKPGLNLRELHGNFFNVMVDPIEPLSTELAELFFAMKLDLVITSWPMSQLLFSFAFPKDPKKVLKIEDTDLSLTDVSDGAQLLILRCAYVRKQYDEGLLTSVHMLELIRGGQSFIDSVKKTLPHLVAVVKAVRDTQIGPIPGSNKSTHDTSPSDTPSVARFPIARENLASTAAYLAEALSTVDLRLRGNMVPSIRPLHSSHTATPSTMINTLETIPPTIVPSMEPTYPAPTSTRRVWSPTEESVLLSGLASVGGPHWTKILALHGIDGTESDVLKDRTQVQLKDKARNLKLAFMKTGQEIPEALKNVTGDLEKRRVKRKRAGDDTGEPETQEEEVTTGPNITPGEGESIPAEISANDTEHQDQHYTNHTQLQEERQSSEPQSNNAPGARTVLDRLFQHGGRPPVWPWTSETGEGV